MRITLLLLLLAIGINSYSQTKVYVDSAATGLNNGTSWANAYISFESALNQARAGTVDSILVARGTYKPSQVPPGSIGATGSRDFTFYFPEFGAFVGGFPSGGGTRNPKINPTILSGDIGVTGDPDDNTYHVTMFHDCEVDLYDFIISDGVADGTDSLSIGTRKVERSKGGGIFNDNAVDDATGIIVRNNFGYDGAGIANERLSWTFFRSCFFTNNFAFDRGGAIFIDTGSTMEATNCVFEGNVANNGGAVYNYRSHSLIYHCTFANNSVFGIFGGAIFNYQVWNCDIRNTVFAKNNDSGLGYGMFDSNADIVDLPISTGVTGTSVTFSSLQGFTEGIDCVYSGDGGLLDPSDPDGPDDIWGTSDDGLMLTAASPGIDKGGSGTANADVLGLPRNIAGSFDIGAYEIDPCSKLTSRTVYVDSSLATGNHSGNSWNNALNNLQAAINLVVTGCADSIKVAKGTYYPSTTPRNWTNPLIVFPVAYFTFHLPANCVLMGGYSSGGAQRDPDLYPTILTQKPDFARPTSQTVMVINSTNIVFDGFTMMTGRVEHRFQPVTIGGTTYERIGGAGMFVSGSSLLVNNCRFLNNLSQQKGGALYAENTLLKLENTVFQKNRAYDNTSFLSFGGAIYLKSMLAGTYLKKCNLSNNSVHFYGGAIALENCLNPIAIDSCQFEKNSTESVGGGTVGGGVIYAISGSQMVIHHSIFNNNSSYRGGVMNMPDAGNISISQSFFTNNTASHNGGAIYYSSTNKELNISNSLFYNNSAASGGALDLLGTTKIFYSNFYKNLAAASGGAILNNPGNSIIAMGTVFWDNQQAGSTTAPGSDISNAPSPFAGYSFFQSYTNNVSHNTTGIYPEFRDTANVVGPDNSWGTSDDGLHLKVNSPLINETGGDYAVYGFGTDPIDPITDIQGSPRIQARFPDVGPYETSFCELAAFSDRTVYVDSSVTGGNHSGTSWSNAFSTLEEALKVGRAHCIDTIKVAKGTYVPVAEPGYNQYNTGPLKIFNIPDSVFVQGGYPSGGGVLNIPTNPTILDGHLADGLILFSQVKNSTVDGFILDARGIRADASDFTVKNCVVQNGFVNGSPVYFTSSNGKIINCVFKDNYGTSISGAIRQENSNIDYINSVFVNNFNNSIGGGSIGILGTGTANIINCTVFKNRSSFGGAITCNSSSALVNVYNTLFWGNRNQSIFPDPTINEIWMQSGTPAQVKISHSLFEFAATPVHDDSSIYTINPGFADTLNLAGPDGVWRTADDGLSLSDTSVVINEGSNSFVPAGISTDIAGLTRIANGKVDIGAYEFECTEARGYTNKLVPLGTEEITVNRLLGCGSLRYMESQISPQKYIVFINDNGNVINPSPVTVDATTNLVNFRTNGTDSAMLAHRMVSIIAPGTFTANGGVRVRVYYDPAEFVDLPHGLRSWFKHPAHTKADVLNDLTFNGLQNATLLSPSSTGIENGITYVEFSNITSFSTFGFLGLTELGPLPVTFLSFTAQEDPLHTSALLDWNTGWEKNNDRFEIERSADGIQWKKVGSVNSNGSASQGASYSFTDNSPDLPQSFYRIKQVDLDGKYRYSLVRKVAFHSNDRELVISPNPAATEVNIRFQAIQPVVNFEIIDIGGRVKSKGVRVNVRQFSLPVQELANGIYLLKINNSARKLIINR